MAREKPLNDDTWFDPHPGEDFDEDADQPGVPDQSAANRDQSCALAADPLTPGYKDPPHDQQEKNHPE